MAKPDDMYNANPAVAPQTGSPGDTVQVRANPASFGASVGQAVQGLGQTFDKLGDIGANYMIQRQGQINETLATNADSQYAEATGTIYGGYKALKGLDAVAAKDQTVADILGTRQKIRDSLPSDAVRRSFDLMAVRREGFMVQDINGYAAGQVKAAHTSSLVASAGLALDNTSRPEVAFNDMAFGNALGDMKSQLVGAFTADAGYASVTHMDPRTGDITFDNTPEGHDADAQWQSYYNKYLGKAWENKLDVLAFDPEHGNVNSAVRALEDNKDKIPADAYARISAKLAGPYKNAQMGSLAAGAASDAEAGWQAHITGANPPGQGLGTFTPDSIKVDPAKSFGDLLGVPVQINSGFRTPGHNTAVGGVPNSEHTTGNAWDLTPQGMPSRDAALALAQKLTAQGIKFDQIIDEHGDVHVGFGPQGRGEVLDRSGSGPGSWKYTKLPVPLTGSNVPDVPGGPTGGQNYINKADYIDANMGTMLQNVFRQAQQRFPDRPDLWDQASRMAETQLTNIVRIERGSIKASADNILDAAINGKYTHGVPISDVTQLDAIPQLANQWRDYQLQAGQYGVQTVQRIIQSNARGQAPTFGTNFYHTLTKVMDGSYTDLNQVAGDLDVAVDPKHQPLTNTGFKMIRQIMNDEDKDPSNKAFYTQAFNWMNSANVRGAITATGRIPGANSPELDANFETALMSVLPKLVQGHGQGLTFQQMTDPKSKDYVGGAFDAAKYTTGDLTKHLTKGMPISPVGAPAAGQPAATFTPDSIKTMDDLVKAAGGGKVTKEQYYNIATQHGWYTPPVPLEH